MGRTKQAATKNAEFTDNCVQARKSINITGRYAGKKMAIKTVKSPSPLPRSKISNKAYDERSNMVDYIEESKKDLTKKTKFLMKSLPMRPFQRIVKDIAQSYIPDCKFQADALLALQEAAEDYMINFFKDSLLCQLHAGRKTLIRQDFLLVQKLRRTHIFEPLQFFQNTVLLL